MEHAMPINSNLLSDLRKKKGLTVNQLANMSKVSRRTIQRLENPPNSSKEKSSSKEHKPSSYTPQENTLNRLAKALHVSPDVLTGDSQPPESDKISTSDTETERTRRIGALIAPKVRLAYDLVKRRYNVSVTEIINMAPLFFVLLAEGSLAWRRKKVQEASELIGALEQGQAEVGHELFAVAEIVGGNAEGLEKESIRKADLFGEHLLSGCFSSLTIDEIFDPSKDNPFANYLRKLINDLDRRDIVDKKGDDLGSFGSPWWRFPDYDICVMNLMRLPRVLPMPRELLKPVAYDSPRSPRN